MNERTGRLRRMPLASVLVALGMLAACGGGGGGSRVQPVPTPPSPPAPSPTPAPTPTPTPPPTNFSTAEVNRSDGPQYHGAVTAWQQGVAGNGATIAIVDTGIDLDSPEFAGRIHPDSRDVASSRTADAVDDHGTNVALVAGAALDGEGVVGIAYQADLLALRADRPGSCDGDTPEDTALECSFFDSDIAEGIDQAVASGATVINLSLGGEGAGAAVLAAVRRASAAGVAIVVAAGNEGEGDDPAIDPNNPTPFAAGIRQAGGDNVIIVGSVDDAGSLSAFSNRAGSEAAFFLTARGERICCVYENGEIYVGDDADGQFVLVFSGTSFAAPQVAGAIALLKQAFPNLTAAEMVSILLDSAREAGTAGTDAQYGRGILDIAAAFAPAGTTTLAGSTSVVRIGDNIGVGSRAMGDAMAARQGVTGVLTDEYARAYSYDLALGLRGAAPERRLRNALSTQGRFLAAGNRNLSLAFTVSDPDQSDRALWSRPLQLSAQDGDMARVLAGRIAARIAPDLQLGFAVSEASDGLVAQLRGAERPAFLIARDAAGDTGFIRDADLSFALRRNFGRTGVTLSAASGEAWLGNSRYRSDIVSGQRERYDTRTFAVAADRRFGPLAATLGLSWLEEDRTILGGYFHDSLAAGGADSLFVDAGLSLALDHGWQFDAAFRQGVTRAGRVGLVRQGSRLLSNAWSFDVSRTGWFGPSDRLALRIAQPLRVSDGGLNLELPVSYDYATETPGYGVRHISLAPTGRELMGELRWSAPFYAGDASASLFYRHEPGHYAGAPADAGLAVSWRRQF